MKVFEIFTLFFLFLTSSVVAAEEKSDSLEESKAKVLQGIKAEYQIKASFFYLPIKASIKLKQLEQNIYEASIRAKSPFFKVDQKEKARIQNCQVELLAIDSKGSRVGASDWKETIEVQWPEREVRYKNGEEPEKKYQAEFVPTGFASLFAHQYISHFKQESSKALTYVQSKKGWRTDYKNKGTDKEVKSKFYKKSVSATRFVTPRSKLKEEDMPTVWYRPDQLGAFPLKLSMKLGVFRLEANLKKLSIKEDEVGPFFKNWGC